MCVIRYVSKCAPYCILESAQLNNPRHITQSRNVKHPAARLAIADWACSPVPIVYTVGPEARAKEQDGLCTLCL